MGPAGRQILKYCIVLVEGVLNRGQIIKLDGVVTGKLCIVAKLIGPYQKIIEGLFFPSLMVSQM